MSETLHDKLKAIVVVRYKSPDNILLFQKSEGVEKRFETHALTHKYTQANVRTRPLIQDVVIKLETVSSTAGKQLSMWEYFCRTELFVDLNCVRQQLR